MSKVLKDFMCKVTGELYNVGDEYSGDRTKELQELGYVEISEDLVNEEWPKHVGGGYYELSNGEKVKGKDAAISAQKEIEVSNASEEE